MSAHTDKDIHMPVLLNMGFGNVVLTSRVVAVVTSEGLPMKKLRDQSREKGMLVDVSGGRRTRSIIITDSGHIFLSALQPETINGRLRSPGDKDS